VGIAHMQGFREEMEDAHTCAFSYAKKETSAFFGIFDGHSGSFASNHSSNKLHLSIQQLNEFTVDAIKEKVLDFDIQFLKDQPNDFSGCTATFCIAQKKVIPQNSNENQKVDNSMDLSEDPSERYELIIGNIGDSRVLLLKKDGSYEELTQDHKPSDPIERDRIVKAGGFVSANRVNGQLALSRAIGDRAYKSNSSLSPNSQQVIAVPDIRHTIAQKGDYIFLACDGIFEQMSNSEVMKFIHNQLFSEKNEDLADVVSQLTMQSLSSGSRDNMSSMLIYLGDGTNYNQKKSISSWFILSR